MAAATVLIVDSDARRLDATCRFLGAGRYNIVYAISESAAVGLAAREKPDLILLRLGSETELFHKLSETAEPFGALLAVFLEQSASAEQRRNILSLKAAAFFHENLAQDELIASIDALIRQKRLIEQLKQRIDIQSGQDQSDRDGVGAAGSGGAANSQTTNKATPLRDRLPALYQALLSRYEEAVKQVLLHRIYKTDSDAFEPFRQIASELFLAQATARDALELHYQTLRRIAPAPDAPRAQGYLEVGRTTIIGLMGDLLTCYRDAQARNAFESPHSNGLEERFSGN